jgi:hypothetical protein
VFALGARADASAIPALEELLKSNDLSIEMAPIITTQIARLKRPAKDKSDSHADAGDGDDEDEPGDSVAANNKDHAMVARLDKLEHMMQEMNDRLKSIEGRLPAKP